MTDEYEDDIQTIHKHRTFRYGVGIGSRIGLGRSFGLEIRADYTRGNQATYFDLDQTVETSTSIEYESQSWPHTDLFVYGIALNWKLFRPTPSNNDYSSPSNGTYSSPSNRTYDYNDSRTTTSPSRTTTTRTTKQKKKVTTTNDIKKKEKEKKITW